MAYGFRLPSALDNRPLTFEEFEHRVNQVVYVSATPGPVRADQVGGRRGRADHPADRPGRSERRDPAGQGPGGRPAGRDPQARGRQPARAGDDADQAHGRGPGGVLLRSGRALPLSALGGEHARPHQDSARPAPRRVRRADRDQPAARGAGPAGGVAGGDSGCRQGRLPAVGRLADPDHRPRGAPRGRPRDPVRRRDDRQHAAGDRRDRRAAAQIQTGVQRARTTSRRNRSSSRST